MQDNKKLCYRGWIRQVPIYLGKFFRMFVYMDDWKLLPMAALIAALVSYVIRGSMAVTMEGTLKGSLALSCICIWNGFFNSIQVVCRERNIVKREHRGGMYLRSYIFSHMVYQASLCICQAIITTLVYSMAGIHFPSASIVTNSVLLDLTITFFLITYASDMMSLLISCIAKTTTAAMTIMPFVLIFQLLFSGAVFTLQGGAEVISDLTIAKAGMCAICAVVGYNNLPTRLTWNMLNQFKEYTIEGIQPIKLFVQKIEEEGKVEELCLKAGQATQKVEYASTVDNITSCWFTLLIFAIVFALLALFALRRIDNDKR